MGFVLVIAAIFAAMVTWVIFKANQERDRINMMSPERRADYLRGPKNEHLVCPHCQTKGTVRAKRVARVVTTTGKVGGILKTDTRSSTTTQVTQHHCDQCTTTWDV